MSRILVLLVILAALAAILSQCGSNWSPIPAVLPHDTPVQTDRKTIILNQLRQVNEMASSVMGIVAIVSSSQSKEMAGLEIGSTNLLYMGVAYSGEFDQAFRRKVIGCSDSKCSPAPEQSVRLTWPGA